ncbi:MAG: DMT family transporter [Elainellaceae cyanobacterium]
MRLSDVAELLLLAALWGGSFLLMRVAAPVLGPVWLIEVRVLLAGLALLPVLARLNLLKELRRNAVPLLIVGCINSAVPFVLFAFASLSLPAGFTSILNGTVPLFGTVVAALWLKERLTPPRLIGFVLGFIGVVILVGWQVTVVTSSFIMAVAAGLAAALMYAIAAPYIKRSCAGIPALVVMTGSQLGAALVLLPALPFTLPQQTPTVGVVAAVVALALLSTGLYSVLPPDSKYRCHQSANSGLPDSPVCHALGGDRLGGSGDASHDFRLRASAAGYRDRQWVDYVQAVHQSKIDKMRGRLKLVAGKTDVWANSLSRIHGL